MSAIRLQQDFTPEEKWITNLMDEETLQLQKLIQTGTAWHMEGSIGRAAMGAIECGQCFLPDISYRDFYGNKIPARSELKAGAKGTLELSEKYYNDKDC